MAGVSLTPARPDPIRETTQAALVVPGDRLRAAAGPLPARAERVGATAGARPAPWAGQAARRGAIPVMAARKRVVRVAPARSPDTGGVKWVAPAVLVPGERAAPVKAARRADLVERAAP